MAALEGKWLVLSGCVQVDAGKPLIIAARLDRNELGQPEFFKDPAPKARLKNRLGCGTGVHADGGGRGHIQ
jgi:hypothetical protein